MTEWIVEILIWVMNATHYVTHNWGIDIILLTILVRLLLYPLNVSMNKNMKLMQKAQPEMKEVQEKYKETPEELNKRMMEVYKKYKINPAASCLPLFIQMPIFIALFRLLRDPRWYLRLPGFENASLLGVHLTLPPQLTHPYPEIAMQSGVIDLFQMFNNPWFSDRFLYIYSIPMLLAYMITMLLQQKMMQSTTQTQQSGQPNTMALMMPMFIIFGVFFPAGLLAYFTTSNLLQIVTYWRIRREVAAEEEAEEDGSAPKPEADSEASNKMSPFSLDRLLGWGNKPQEPESETSITKEDGIDETQSKSNKDSASKGKKKKKK